jgi:hypothetical protein
MDLLTSLNTTQVPSMSMLSQLDQTVNGGNSVMPNVLTVTQPVNADVKTTKNVPYHVTHHVRTALAQLPTTVLTAGVMLIVPTQNSNLHAVNAI